MEKESFMDESVAKIMNENFVCIKVDREERPDIDGMYMDACKLITGGGGWPLNAFALPDGKPFFANTYYSKDSWKNLLIDISKKYKEKHALVVKQAEALTKGIAAETLFFTRNDNTIPVVSTVDYQDLFDSIYLKLDPAHGGLKGSPKFPMPAVTEFLLQYYYQTGNEQAFSAASLTLTKMALSGIYDQLGGGFARYATDAEWRIPHFEKMLYDNAQLVSLYAHAYQLTQNDFYRTILIETISWIEKDLFSPFGGFYSSVNADTDNGEGEFYVWKEKEFKMIAGDNNLLSEYFNITSSGNWKNGNNILIASFTAEEFARQKKLSPGQFIPLLDKAKTKLLTERNKRLKPSVDTKVLTVWNAMMVKAYADAYLATSKQEYLTKALAIANFLEKNMLGANGRLKRVFKEGKISVNAFLDDYSWTAYAFIKLYQVCFDIHWLNLGKEIVNQAIKSFYNESSDLFFYSSNNNSNLAVNRIETNDDVIASSNSIMANVLYSFGVIYDNQGYIAMSKKMLGAVSNKLRTYPVYHAQWSSLAGLFAYGTYEIAVIGEDAIGKNKALQKKYLPNCIVMGETDEENLPLLENKLRESKTLIYVCTNKVCKKPVEEINEALSQIRSKPIIN